MKDKGGGITLSIDWTGLIDAFEGDDKRQEEFERMALLSMIKIIEDERRQRNKDNDPVRGSSGAGGER